MREGLRNIAGIPELRKRLLFTILILAVFRVGAHIPIPGINGAALAAFFTQTEGTILDLVDMFAGGALERMTIFALGIMPYISASIILQLLTVVVPYLEKLSKEGELGRRKITQYTRYGTVLLAAVQSLGISFGLESMRGPAGEIVVSGPGWDFRIMTVLTMTSGTALIMWLGEQISARGIGNGISLLIFAGIVTSMPGAIVNTLRLSRAGELAVLLVVFLIIFMVAVVAVIIFLERGQRRIPVQYAKRLVGRRMYGGQSTHLPLKVNTAGVIPVIFASSILVFPATVANFVSAPWARGVASFINPGGAMYNLIYVVFIIFFCYFYTAVVFNPVDVADNMRKYGGFIPGIRPGKKTGEYIDRVLSRITLGGALYLAAISILPTLLIIGFNVPFFFGGTALLIVVGVALDTASQMEAHMLQRHYEGFLKKARIKGRRG